MFIKTLFYSIIIIIFFNEKSFLIKSYISLPFKYINKHTGESNANMASLSSYFESFFHYSIYTTISNDIKNINFHLTLDRYATYISENSLKEIDSKLIQINNNYNEEELYSLEYIGILRASFGKSSFNFLFNNTKNISYNNFSFFIAKKINDESEYTKRINYLAEEKEEIGLNIYKGNKAKEVIVEEDDPFEDLYPDNNQNDEDEDDYEYGNIYNKNKNKTIKGERYINKNNGYLIEQNSNLINQLKNQKLISSYSFMIKYNNKNEEKGDIFIGGLPHEYDPRHYSENYFIYDYVYFNEKNPGWRIGFNNIKYGDIDLNSIKSGEFSLDFGFIMASTTYKDKLDDYFFKNEKYKEYCKEEKVGIYYVKYCKEKIINEFKTLSFYLSNILNDKNENNKIEFNYKDLFIRAPGKSDLYYFQIVFETGCYKWVFGRPLFKKYPTVLDQEKKVFGFYIETGEYDIVNTNKDKNKGKSNILSFSWVLIFVSSICLIIFGIYFYSKIPNIKRRRKANELDDDFDYEPVLDNKNEKNKLFKL